MVGLYLYDRTSMEDAAERRAKKDHFRPGDPLLPVAEMNEMKQNGHAIEPRKSLNENFGFPPKRESSPMKSKEGSGWLAPGTKQESTWAPGDRRG